MEVDMQVVRDTFNSIKELFQHAIELLMLKVDEIRLILRRHSPSQTYNGGRKNISIFKYKLRLLHNNLKTKYYRIRFNIAYKKLLKHIKKER